MFFVRNDALTRAAALCHVMDCSTKVLHLSLQMGGPSFTNLLALRTQKDDRTILQHVLAPLTELTGKGAKWTWDTPQQKAFEETKRAMSDETMLACPDFDKPFHVYTDASDCQLGAVTMQDDKPLAFCSRMLDSAQKNCTTGEQELLSVVEQSKKFAHCCGDKTS